MQMMKGDKVKMCQMNDMLDEFEERLGRRGEIYHRNVYTLSNTQHLHVYNIKTGRWTSVNEALPSFDV